jgi:hypothetical protein
MIGTWDIQVLAARAFTIHGDLYYEVQALRADVPSNNAYVFRVPQHAIKAAPASGQRLRLTFLMGQITSAEQLAI